MTITVSDAALKETTKCHKHFQCLSGDIQCLCKIAEKQRKSGTMASLECLDRAYCNYRRPSEGFLQCTCPVRNDLFGKYGL